MLNVIKCYFNENAFPAWIRFLLSLLLVAIFMATASGFGRMLKIDEYLVRVGQWLRVWLRYFWGFVFVFCYDEIVFNSKRLYLFNQVESDRNAILQRMLSAAVFSCDFSVTPVLLSRCWWFVDNRLPNRKIRSKFWTYSNLSEWFRKVKA